MQTITIADTSDSQIEINQSVSAVDVSNNESSDLIINQDVVILNVSPDVTQTVVVESTPTIINLLHENAAEVIEIRTVGAQGPAGVAVEYTGPEFSYDVDGRLERVDYDDGSYKTFTYTDGVLSLIDFAIFGSYTVRKEFVYSNDVLIRIDQSIV